MKFTFQSYLLISIFVVLGVGLFFHLDDIGLRAEEPRRAIVGIETMESGNLIVPQIHESTYYNKPPFYNWVLATTFIVVSSTSEWAVRLPGVLSFLALGFFLFLLARRYLDSRTALLSALFFLTGSNLLFYGSVNAGEIDLFYALVTFLQVSAIFVFAQKKQLLLLFLLSYLFAAIGTLTKGLPSVAFQGLTLLPYLIVLGKWKWLFSWKHFLGIAVYSVLVGGYFYLYSLQDDVQGFLANLYKESSQRSANEHGLGTIIPHLFAFPFEVLSLLLPWSLLIVYGFRRGTRHVIRNQPFLLFSVVFLLANIVLYWISPDIRGRYLYMFFPFIVVVITFFYVKRSQEMPRLNLVLNWIFGVLIGGMAAFFFAFPWLDEINAQLDNPMLVGTLFGALFTLVLFFFIRKPQHRIFILVLALVLGRVGHNVALLPNLHANARCATYIANVDSILEIAGDERVALTGRAVKWVPDVSLLGVELGKEELKIPPPLPYQIPYYYYQKSGWLLTFEPEPVAGNYYIAHTQFSQHLEKEILYSFRDEWTHRDMVLFIAK